MSSQNEENRTSKGSRTGVGTGTRTTAGRTAGTAGTGTRTTAGRTAGTGTRTTAGRTAGTGTRTTAGRSAGTAGARKTASRTAGTGTRTTAGARKTAAHNTAHRTVHTDSERMPKYIVGSADDFREPHTKWWITLGTIAVGLILAFVIYNLFLKGGNSDSGTESGSSNQGGETAVTEMAEETEGSVWTDEADASISFNPHAVDSTQPANMIMGTGIEVNGVELTNLETYLPDSEISFEAGSEYTQNNGVFTFRGNNFRSDPAAGVADITKNTITQEWSQQTGATTYEGATWSGSGWTGQPLMRKWTREEKAHMNMADWAKEDDELVEVIYATMDGNIYFLDLKTGQQTRDPMVIGMTFKGAGALDPRGYPLLYLGGGYNSYVGKSHAYIISLVDCSILYEFGEGDPFSLRSNVGFFDSSPLVDAETDTLIWPGENGVIYLIHLNSSWDAASGTLSINPDNVVKWRYQGNRTGLTYYDKYWLGIEDSAAVYKGYLFAADNGGHLFCLNLNNLMLVWVQDTLDDTNSTPVLSNEDGHLYLYIGPSFHLGWRSTSTAPVPIMKIDAETGEIVWQKDYECFTMDGVSGGLQSTIALGQKKLKGYVYATMAMTGDTLQGVCVCLDCKTGEVVWEHKSYYAWSSPILVYNKDGSARLLYANCAGYMYMLDPLTGKELATSQLSDGAIEASPAAWENYVVIGTRACKIWGLKLE